VGDARNWGAVVTVNSDARNKAQALSRIRQLASSGLPLEPFVQTTLELIGDAVPSSPHRAIHVGTENSNAYICAGETSSIITLHDHYFVKSPPRVSGTRSRIDLEFLTKVLPSRTIWLQEQAFLPDFHRAEGFNEAYRPLGWHHCMAVVFHEGNDYAGYYGIWRTAQQKPFSRDDVEFLHAVAAHITHGLKIAQTRIDASIYSAGFAPVSRSGTGVILVDSIGKPDCDGSHSDLDIPATRRS
jgi:hypothetical protein